MVQALPSPLHQQWHKARSFSTVARGTSFAAHAAQLLLDYGFSLQKVDGRADAFEYLNKRD